MLVYQTRFFPWGQWEEPRLEILLKLSLSALWLQHSPEKPEHDASPLTGTLKAGPQSLLCGWIRNHHCWATPNRVCVPPSFYIAVLWKTSSEKVLDLSHSERRVFIYQFFITKFLHGSVTLSSSNSTHWLLSKNWPSRLLLALNFLKGEVRYG